MTPEDLAPVALMFEVRERLVRIETKMDSSTERVEAVETKQDNHETRIVALETEQASQKARVALLVTLGGAAATVASLFGDKLLALF